MSDVKIHIEIGEQLASAIQAIVTTSLHMRLQPGAQIKAALNLDLTQIAETLIKKNKSQDSCSFQEIRNP